jgi:hypothetical protein
LLSLLVAACAIKPPPGTVAVAVPSTLAHGADSTGQLDDGHFAFAHGCLQGPPAFWGRYFNHSDLPERENRLALSFARETETPRFKQKRMKLLPIFAQNLNDVGEEAGRVHGAVNARDLIAAVGAQRLVRHMATRPLYVVLNEETPSGVLSIDHYRGWVAGFAEALTAVGANAASLRPIVYGNLNARPELKGSLELLNAWRATVPYAGFWRARVDPSLQSRANSERCGRLADWNRNNQDWDEASWGPLLLRQYVLDAQGAEGVSVDLNAINPAHEVELLNGLLSFDDAD